MSKSQAIQEEITKDLQDYGGDDRNLLKEEKKALATHIAESRGQQQLLHSPSSSSSSLFSTVDCSSFSSRSDASSFAKREICPSTPSSASVTSSLEFVPSSIPGSCQSDLSTAVGRRYSGFAFSEQKLVDADELDDLDQQQVDNSAIKEESDDATKKKKKKNVPVEEDGYDSFPIWTDRMRYCSKDIHSCINPCFDERAFPEISSEIRTSRRKKLAKSLGGVISRHLVLSPGSTSRKSSYERFTSRLALMSPLRFTPATPTRTFSSRRQTTADAASDLTTESPTSSENRSSFCGIPRSEFQQTRASTSSNFCQVGTPNRHSDTAKALGCLRISLKASESVEEMGGDFISGELGKNRCLPSPRLSFGGSLKSPLSASKRNQTSRVAAGMSTTVPLTAAKGQIHLVVRDEQLPNFTLLIDGLEEVLVAKGSRTETDEPVYTFYSCKSRGRNKGGKWKNWVRKDKSAADYVGRMCVNSRSGEDNGSKFIDLEFVVTEGGGRGGDDINNNNNRALLLSPRLSFSTWETSGDSPRVTYASPSPRYYGLQSPMWISTPSPASRFGLFRTPVTPQVERGSHKLRHSRSRSQNSSPLRVAKPGKEDKDGFEDGWSDTESVEVVESEVGAIVIRVPGGGSEKVMTLGDTLYLKWGWHKQVIQEVAAETETKENVGNVNRSKVTVILPAGNHGLPLHGSSGPQPLVQRWRSGGRCDCGSWDLGCGLTVLGDQHQHEKQQDDDEDALRIFMQGKKEAVLSLNAVNEEEGVFALSLKSPMSYLQAFASSVAILYSKAPSVVTVAAAAAESKKEWVKPPRTPLRPLTPHRRLNKHSSPYRCSSPLERL